MIEELVEFSNQNIRLKGTLYTPVSGGPHPVMVVLHGATGGLRNFPFYTHLHTRLPQHGIAVLVYDRRGSGQSNGSFETADFDQLAQDAIAGIDYLRSRKDIDHTRIGAYGISQGGWIAPIVAARRHELSFLIVVSSSGVSPTEQMNYGVGNTLRKGGFPEQVIDRAIAIRNQVDEYYRGHVTREVVQAEVTRARGEAWFPEAYIDATLPHDVTLDKWYYEFDYDPLPVWRQVDQPTLFIFAEDDQWVPVPESMSNFKVATAHLQDVTMAQIEGTDHLMGKIDTPTTSEVSDQYLEVMIDWLITRLGLKK
jgi:uncharacterized protein